MSQYANAGQVSTPGQALFAEQVFGFRSTSSEEIRILEKSDI